jgi:hypothetical protein
MDSHLDVSLGGDDHMYPRELRKIARRTGAHTAFRRIRGAAPVLLGGMPGDSHPKLIVVIPERMLAAHAMDIESQLPSSLRILDLQDSISSCVDFLKEAMDIEVYRSPPKSLLNLVRLTKKTRAWILDVDVDYMHEMQAECYTRIIKPEPGVLQTVSNVLTFIKKAMPETITISEAKVSAIRNPKSEFSTFIADLKTMGYQIEERGVFTSDSEVLRGIAVCKEFYRTVSKVLMTKNVQEMMKGDFEGFQKQEEVAAKQFFTIRGYST